MMDQKYPPSILVALYTSMAIAILYLVIRLVGGATGGSILLETLGMFTFGLITFTAVLEFFLYRKLKHLNALKTREIQREIQRLQEMEAFRREFLGDVSHELKTPIFAIEGFIETLLDGALEDQKVNRKFLQKAGKHAERLSNLVSDILIISQLESGELSMHIEKFNLNDMVTDLVDSLSYKFTKKDRDIHIDIRPNGLEKVNVVGDILRIEQVLRNLIDNAVKYGDLKGNILLILEDAPEGKITVKIKDNGPGIDPVHQARLFERFYRVDKSRSRKKGGTGLGLAICKHFIEAHKEKIWVESDLGKGATFNFTLKKSR